MYDNHKKIKLKQICKKLKKKKAFYAIQSFFHFAFFDSKQILLYVLKYSHKNILSRFYLGTLMDSYVLRWNNNSGKLQLFLLLLLRQ